MFRHRMRLGMAGLLLLTGTALAQQQQPTLQQQLATCMDMRQTLMLAWEQTQMGLRAQYEARLEALAHELAALKAAVPTPAAVPAPGKDEKP